MNKRKQKRTGAWLCLLLCLLLLSALPLRAAAAGDAPDSVTADETPGDSAETLTVADDAENAAGTVAGENTADAVPGDGTAGTDTVGDDGTAGEGGDAGLSENDNASGSQSGTQASAGESEGSSVGISGETDGGFEEKPTFSDRVVGFFGDNCAELLSALTLVSSLAIALLFKKGLLPALSSALKGLAGGLSQGVDEMGKMRQKMSQDTDAAMTRFTAAVTPTLTAMEKLAGYADAMAEHTDKLQQALSEADDSRSRTEAVLRAQSELFYRFFMAADLPRYQKDALGEAYEKMNRLLAEDGGEKQHETAGQPQ